MVGSWQVVQARETAGPEGEGPILPPDAWKSLKVLAGSQPSMILARSVP